MKILTQEVDPEDFAEVPRCQATIGCQVFDHLQLKLKKSYITFAGPMHLGMSALAEKKPKQKSPRSGRSKLYSTEVLNQEDLDHKERRFYIRKSR